jgi:flagellar hook-length control protein FliK
MNVNLLTIGNMFAGTTTPPTVSSKPEAAKKTSQFSLTDNDNQQHLDISEKKTTDNTQIQTSQWPETKQVKSSEDTPQEKLTSKTPQIAKGSTKSKNQVLSNGAFSKTNTVQPVLAEAASINITLTVKKDAARAVPIQKGSNTQSKTIISKQVDKLIPVYIQPQNTAQPKSNLSAQTAPKTEEKSVKFITGQNQKELKNATPEFIKKQPTENAPQKVTVNFNKEQPQKDGVTIIQKPAMPETREKPVSTKVATVKKTFTADVKADKKASESSAEVKGKETFILNKKRLISKYNADSDGKSNITKLKTVTATISSSEVKVKSPETGNKSAVTNPEKIVPIAEKTNVNKSDGRQIPSQSPQNKIKESAQIENDSSGETATKKLKATDVQISSEQIKGRENSSTGNNSNSDTGHTLSHNNVQAHLTEQIQTSTENTKTAETPKQSLPSDVSVDVGKQILESIHNSISRQGSDQQITIRLNPPELGKVFIKFQEQDNQITGLMEVSKNQTRFEIEQALPQIVRNLADSGIHIKRFDVVLNNNEGSEQQFGKDQLLQGGGTQNHGSTNSGSHENEQDARDINEWLAGNNSYQNISEWQEMLTAEGSINVLL